MCRTDNLTADSSWQAKREFRAELAKHIRPNHRGKLQPKPATQPRGGKQHRGPR